jgi:hypothetical protein
VATVRKRQELLQKLRSLEVAAVPPLELTCKRNNDDQPRKSPYSLDQILFLIEQFFHPLYEGKDSFFGKISSKGLTICVIFCRKFFRL